MLDRKQVQCVQRLCESQSIQWGVARDIDSRLYINNTEYAESMKDEHRMALYNIL